MTNRRKFLQGLAGGAAGAVLAGSVMAQAPKGGSGRREVRVGGKRVKVIDIHGHANFPEVADLLKDTPLAKYARQAGRALGPERIAELDKRGIDTQVLDVNTFWWYEADRDLATKIVRTHDEGLAKLVDSSSGRFVALSSPALQFPELAAEQLEYAVKKLGHRGAAIGGSVKGEPLSNPKYDPFWAKVQELNVLVFMHPNNSESIVRPGALEGAGDLGNVIGNPFETTVFLSHLIFEGVFDRFPNLKICGAHAGGYLPSYFGRTEVACDVRNNAKCQNKKRPKDYLHTNILVDSMIFSPEGVRHLVAEMGASQVVYGTDVPFVWPDTVDAILQAEIPDATKEAILGGNLAKLLKL